MPPQQSPDSDVESSLMDADTAVSRAGSEQRGKTHADRSRHRRCRLHRLSHGSRAARAGDNVVIVDEVNDYYDPGIKERNLRKLIARYGNRVAVVRADICDAATMQGVFSDHKPTRVVHLAARAGVRPSIEDPMIYLKANVEGTTKLLELAVKHNIEHFVYASSSSVYGGLKKTLFSETDVVDSPVSQYAATKKMCELLAHTYYHLYGLNSTGLRFFTVYGPSGRPDMAAYKFIDRIANGRSIDQYGDGSSERDWTYVGDIVDGILRALDRPMGCEVFNLGNGNPIRCRASLRRCSVRSDGEPRSAFCRSSRATCRGQQRT